MGKGCGWPQFTSAATRFCPGPRLGLCSMPMRATLFTLLCVVCAVASATTIYKWVDESGITHYSDQPHPNATKVDLSQPQTYTAPRAAAQSESQAEPPPADQPPPYVGCAITQPAAGQIYVNLFSVTVQLQIQPQQRDGDRVVISLDGQEVGGLASVGSQFTITPVERGAHSVQAAIQDQNGQTVCRSSSVSFFVRQPSVQSPTRPAR